MSRPNDNALIDLACFRLLHDPAFEPLRQWWELQLANSPVPAGQPVDPYRLAMAQGDRERLLAIRVRAGRHRQGITSTAEGQDE